MPDSERIDPQVMTAQQLGEEVLAVRRHLHNLKEQLIRGDRVRGCSFSDISRIEVLVTVLTVKGDTPLLSVFSGLPVVAAPMAAGA